MKESQNSAWPQMSREAIRTEVFRALDENINFELQGEAVLGVPASSLDPKVFYSNAPFLAEAPFLSALVANPNHIGCHTLGTSEPFFRGTHRIEKALIHLCATHILNADEACDGYVTAGGTEANIQAVWIYRNYFMQTFGAQPNEITLLCSVDSHYSVYKAADLLNIGIATLPVDQATRRIAATSMHEVVQRLKAENCKYVIAFSNMMTTMFGSIDDPQLFGDVLTQHGMEFMLHVDGAYGGFYHPFSGNDVVADFRNPYVNSVTLDAHKMVQAPYGTGVLVIKKGWMGYTQTQEASYVAGADYTLSGSRSGANAIAVWMILMTYGVNGWMDKIRTLSARADRFSAGLDELGIGYFRSPHSNIITLHADARIAQIAQRFGLVPDNHHAPNWFKVVVMEHATDERLHALLHALGEVCEVNKA